LNITERKQAEAELLRSQRRISLSNSIANVFLISLQEETYANVLEVLLEAFESRYGYFGCINDDGDFVCSSMTRDVWEHCRMPGKSIVFPRSQWGGLWGRSLVEKRTLLANEGLTLPKGHVVLENALVAPIVYRDEVIGQFAVANRAGGYGAEEVQLLDNAASQTAPILFGMLEQDRQRKVHKKLEEQYHQAQKLESVGRLAGGVAHDLNNMLAPIIIYGEMLLEDFDKHDARRASVEQMFQASMRARDVVRQLLAFSRKQTLEVTSLDINSVLKKFEKLLRRTIREDITIEMHQASCLPLIQGDAAQLEQVIINLAVNAQDAMPQGGTLTVETAVVELDEEYAAEHPEVTPGKHVLLVVSDSGHGMEREIQEHIFEPFFTTKPKDQGTGLGLAICYGIVKQHGGHIWVYSEPGEGTTFKIYLPVSEKDPAQKAEAFTPNVNDLYGSETILLVEDDPAVRKSAETALNRFGYLILTAGNGKEALEIVENEGRPVHLLLTDVVMPDMNGKELFQKAAQKRLDLKVLYMSGYTDDVIVHRGVLEEGVDLLPKPFTVKNLAAAVRNALEKHGGMAKKISVSRREP